MTGTQTVGFAGLGRLGLPFAVNLLGAGFDVVGTERGRSAELVAAGGRIAGDGSVRSVVDAASVLFVCVQDDAALTEVIDGPDGALRAARAPTVINMSTVAIPLMVGLDERLAKGGGGLLDCQVSGTPDMAAARQAVVFASGDGARYQAVAEMISSIAPKTVFVGDLGAGTNFKHVANLLAFINVTAAAEAMAFAAAAGLELGLVAQVISQSPGATSGQFNIRAPLMAEQKFDSRLVTVDQTREVCAHIIAHGEEIGASMPLVSVVRDLLEEFAQQGHGDSDPGKLFLYLQERAAART